MKKQTADRKRAAANDKPEAEIKKADVPKSTKAEKPVERYKIGNIATVRGGF